MRRRNQEPYFPSFTLVLTRPQYASRLPERRLFRTIRYHPYPDLPSAGTNDLMMTVDYRYTEKRPKICATADFRDQSLNFITIKSGDDSSAEEDRELYDSLNKKDLLLFSRVVCLVKSKWRHALALVKA